MDDRELEQRLRDRLHARFDDGQPSTELRAGVAQVFATEPRRAGWSAIGGRRFQLGWAVVAVVAVATVAILAANLRLPLGPASPHTPSPAATSVQQRNFVVMSRTADNPTKAQSGLASDVLTARIRALGIGNFSGGTGYGIVFKLPFDGPSDEVIRATLRATGDVAFIPLPAEDYGEGKLTATVGQVLPKDEPALFGWEGIATVAIASGEPSNSIEIALKPTAATAFGDYTTAHVGATFAVVIDGRVALLPSINSPVTSGRVTLSSGAGDSAFAVTAAVLVGGMLPGDWRDPLVPTIISEQAAIDVAMRLYPADGYGQTDIDVVEDDGHWRATWLISLNGSFPGECALKPPPEPTECPSADSIQVRLDAVTGALISSVAPAP
jgi:hypothetical protein